MDDHPPDERDARLALLLTELTDRAQRGEPVDIHDQCRLHPDLADELRQLWGAVMVADAAGSTAASGQTHARGVYFELPHSTGDYELEEEIGRGGMGVVYRARQISLGREVAVKMILRGNLANDSERIRFWAEAEAAARLEHPGIVPVYEVGELDGEPYFSMKYIRGKTLSERLAAGPISPRETAELLRDVARAIQFAHERGVLHRDLKPSNILIDEGGRPHVTDFGLAKRVTGGSLTNTGAVLGTPQYMSPEQAAGTRGVIGPASDVYSLGTILYHLIAGRPPIEAHSPAEALMKIVEQDPVPPRVVNPRADRELELIAVKCLQKPPDLRYPSAGALADDLEAYLNDEPIAARSGRLTQVMSRVLRETHHATVLENWGLLWMWHSLVLFTACLLTNTLYWLNDDNRWHYFVLWSFGFWAWAAVFWALRRRMGPVTFVERQIAHVWAGSMVCIAAIFPFEWWLELEVLTLSPLLALIGGMIFVIKAGILSGAFYLQAILLFATAAAMAYWKDNAHVIYGVVAAACFFFPGLKYYRQRGERMNRAVENDARELLNTKG